MALNTFSRGWRMVAMVSATERPMVGSGITNEVLEEALQNAPFLIEDAIDVTAELVHDNLSPNKMDTLDLIDTYDEEGPGVVSFDVVPGQDVVVVNYDDDKDVEYQPGIGGCSDDDEIVTSNNEEDNQNDMDREVVHIAESEQSFANHSVFPLDSEMASTSEGCVKYRKKKAEPRKWHDVENKKLRELGKNYIGWQKPKGKVGKRGKERKERQMGAACRSSRCQNSSVIKCDLISQDFRKEIFQSFWSLTWDQKRIYVASLVKKIIPKRNTTGGESRRSATLCYSLRVPTGEVFKVCKKMFLATLAIGEWSVLKWVSESKLGICSSQKSKNDEKRRLRNVRQETNDKKAFLEKFIDDLPKLPSHYARRDSTKMYLEPSYNCSMSDVYREYVKAWKSHCNNDTTKPLSRFTFDQVINEKNVAFQHPKKDACDTCLGFEMNTITEEVYKEHIVRKNKARAEKMKDKESGQKGLATVLTQDLQSVKVCPMLNASALYYKTKLCVHNFTIYDVNSNNARCYWFNETEADLSANTFASCLIDYLRDKINHDSDSPIIIWSDGCTYQNRNSVLANALLSFSKEYNVTVLQKYLERGHTQMEADSVHACIERKLKNKRIFLPSDYVRFTEEARNDPPYECKTISFDFTKDFSKSMTYKSIRPGKRVHDPTVTDIKIIKYTPDGNIQVKIDFEGDFNDLPRKRNCSAIKALAEFRQVHRSPLKIKKQKWLHLQQLKSVIPTDCHLFYDCLPYSE